MPKPKGKIPYGSTGSQRNQGHASYDKVGAGQDAATFSVTEAAKARLAELYGGLASLAEPTEQTMRFFGAIADGMPWEESARFFLHVDDEDGRDRIRANPEALALIMHLQGQVAREQYRKVCRDGGPREAFEWLKAHYPDLWNQKQRLDVTSGGEPLKLYRAFNPDTDV